SSGDVWLNKTFSPTSTPNSRSYTSVDTKVEIQVKSGSCQTDGLVADLYVGLPRCCFGVAGNIDGDPGSTINLTDLTILTERLFTSFGTFACPAAANIDGDSACRINLTDVSTLVNS